MAILAVALPISGCGSAGGEEPGESSRIFEQADGPVSKARFIEQANTLCHRTSMIVHDGIQPYIDQGLKAVERPGVARGMVHDIVAPGLETQVVAIGALNWPPGDRREIRAMLSAIEEAAEGGRVDPVGLILHHEQALAKAKQLAADYGASDCGRLWIVLPDPDTEALEETEEEDKDEFIEHADSLCRRATAIVQEGLLPYIRKGPKAIGTPIVVAEMVDEVVALELEAQSGAIRALHPPADDKREIEAILAALEEVGERGRKRPAGLIFHSHRAFAGARRIAEEYGFSYCGRLWIVLPNASYQTHIID